MAARAPYLDADDTDADDLRRLVETAPHEFTANLNFNSDGLRPWFAADRMVKDGGGSVEIDGAVMDSLGGDVADLTLYYQESAVRPPSGGVTPAGTPVEHDTIREFRISVEVCDPVGARKANFHLRPRWDSLRAENTDGETVNVPVPDELANRHTDAVNVRVQGANIEFDRYLPLLREAARRLGIGGRPFRDPHPTSNVQDAERYVRVHKDVSGPIHARDGPLVNLAHVLENDRQGYRKLVQNDDDERGCTIPGYYHTATLGPDRIREVFPSHSLPKEVKHYYAREAADRPPADPLAHPKVGASYQVSRWDGTLSFDPDDLDRLARELDETIYATLADAGLDLRAGGKTYVADEYFDARNASTDASIVSLDVSQVRHEQENIVVRHLADGLSPVEREALDTLVTDGGQVAPADIAEAHDRHLDAVYAALGRMDDLVEREYDSVSLRSTYVAELVHDAIDAAREAVSDATAATAQALDAADRGLDERTSAFVAWCERHGVNFREPSGDDGVSVRLGEVDSKREARRLLREGYQLWQEMNRDLATFRMGTFRYRVEEEKRGLNYLDETTTRRYGGTVWQALD